MTLIIAVRESDASILVAADGLERNSNGIFSVTKAPKLRTARGVPIVWACSGDAMLSDRFTSALRKSSPTSWAAVQANTSAISNLIATTNGERRGLIALVRAVWKEDFGITCLLTGWLEKLAGIWEIDVNGIPTSYWESGFLSMGGFAGEAELIWNAIQNSGLTPLDMLQRIFKAIGEGKRNIGDPIDIWRVTPSGITVLQGRNGDYEEATTREASNQA